VATGLNEAVGESEVVAGDWFGEPAWLREDAAFPLMGAVHAVRRICDRPVSRTCPASPAARTTLTTRPRLAARTAVAARATVAARNGLPTRTALVVEHGLVALPALLAPPGLPVRNMLSRPEETMESPASMLIAWVPLRLVIMSRFSSASSSIWV
jgi:hypothetical protein